MRRGLELPLLALLLAGFPSAQAGETGYPGLLIRGERLLVSCYSSHEGRAAIYLAQPRLAPLLTP